MNDIRWKKSSRSGSGAGNNCVEVGTPADGCRVAVRDTKDRDGGTLSVSPATWTAFVAALTLR